MPYIHVDTVSESNHVCMDNGDGDKKVSVIKKPESHLKPVCEVLM